MGFTIDFKDDIAFVKVTGEFTHEMWAPYIDELYGSPHHRSGMNLLLDMRRAEFGAPFPNDLSEAVSVYKKHRERIGGKAAYVVASDVGYALARLFDVKVRSENDQQRRIFTDLDEALNWLNE